MRCIVDSGQGHSSPPPGGLQPVWPAPNLAVSDAWLVTWDAPISGKRPDLYRVEVAFATSTYEYELDTTSLSLDIVRKVEAHPLEKFTVRARPDNGMKSGVWTDALSFTAPAAVLW